MEHIEVDGVQIAYTVAGRGRPLVLLHGSPCDGRIWQWMIPLLAKDLLVITWDAPGYGRSGDVPESWRTGEYAHVLAGFIDALGIDRPHVVGHSFGSMLALSLFRDYPSVAASLVLVAGYAGWAGSLPADEVSRRLRMFLGMAELGDSFDPTSYPGFFSELVPAEREPATVTMMRENIRPSSIRAAGHIGAETDLRPMLPTIDIPTLVLQGAADSRSPLATGEALHAAIPRSELVVLPKLGHACLIENPEACATAIARFVHGVG